MTEAAIERRLELAASPERVWRALTDADELSSWFGDEAAFEPRPGATGWFGWKAHGRYHARVDEVDEGRRLVWSWARSPGEPVGQGETTRVEWKLESRDGGGTVLHMRETGFESPGSRSANAEGWQSELAELEEYLGEG